MPAPKTIDIIGDFATSPAAPKPSSAAPSSFEFLNPSDPVIYMSLKNFFLFYY